MSYTSHAPEIITETLRENGEFTTGHWSWSRRGGGVGVGARLMLKMGLKYTNIWLGFLLRLAVAIMVAIHHYLSRVILLC